MGTKKIYITDKDIKKQCYYTSANVKKKIGIWANDKFNYKTFLHSKGYMQYLPLFFRHPLIAKSHKL